jgi:predicted transcriptional regulator of viral defense system
LQAIMLSLDWLGARETGPLFFAPPLLNRPKPRAMRAPSRANLACMTVDGPGTSSFGTESARQPAIDRQIAQLAQRQHGVVTLSQLEKLGLGDSGTRNRIATGRLHRVHQGVYAVGHPLLTREGRWMAAVLACGPEAVLSHRSAAALWGLRQDGRDTVDVTASGRRGRMPAGIDAHRHGSLHARDRATVRGIPCTSVPRTLLDLAAVVPPRQLRNAITEAEISQVFDLTAVHDVISRSRHRRGVARLRRAVSAYDARSEQARGELERRFLALCARSELPPPEVNAPLLLDGDPIEADFLWRGARLIVEADGRRFHATASAFERDRQRDQLLMLAGWRVIRCTWRQVVDQPEELTRTLRILLDHDQARA